jgi:ribose-phosphate pyrophosphokinase
MAILDLRKGITKNEEYDAFVFPGGEVHFKLHNPSVLYVSNGIRIISRITNASDLMLLILVVETIRKDGYTGKLEVVLPYMPYQQADRDFSLGECFSLQTVCKMLNTLDVDRYFIFDPHSDVSPALLHKTTVIDNSSYIREVLVSLNNYDGGDTVQSRLAILSPDAGAYKKIGKLCSKLGWQGELVAANKYRSISTGSIESLELSKQDFEGKDVLIIDDICIGGRTFIELAKKLREKNVGKIYLAISHGVFSNGFRDLNEYFEGIFCTDSFFNIEDPNFLLIHEKSCHKVKQININYDKL